MSLPVMLDGRAAIISLLHSPDGIILHQARYNDGQIITVLDPSFVAPIRFEPQRGQPVRWPIARYPATYGKPYWLRWKWSKWRLKYHPQPGCGCLVVLKNAAEWAKRWKIRAGWLEYVPPRLPTCCGS